MLPYGDYSGGFGLTQGDLLSFVLANDQSKEIGSNPHPAPRQQYVWFLTTTAESWCWLMD